MKKNTDPLAHYDRVTAAWEFIMGKDLHYGLFDQPNIPLATATRNLTLAMTSSLGDLAGKSILDVGCGSGGPAIDLVNNFDCTVLGISPSKIGVEIATARATSLGLSPKASFVVADGMNNKLEPSCFDCAWVMESSHLMPDKASLLSECARVLKKGGRLALCDIVLRRDISVAEVVQQRRKFFLLNQVFGRAKMIQLIEYAELAGSFGLKPLSTIDISTETRPTFSAWKRNAEQNSDAICSLIGEDAWKDFGESCDILQGFWDDGLLGYGLFTAERT